MAWHWRANKPDRTARHSFYPRLCEQFDARDSVRGGGAENPAACRERKTKTCE
jgi:hypothetical protein